MAGTEIFDKVVAIVSPFAKDKDALANVSAESSFFGDLKVNSARLVDVILEFEDAFDIEISDDEADGVRTVGDAVAMITRSRS